MALTGRGEAALSLSLPCPLIPRLRLETHECPESLETLGLRPELHSPPQPPTISCLPDLLCSDCWKLGTSARSRHPPGV